MAYILTWEVSHFCINIHLRQILLQLIRSLFVEKRMTWFRLAPNGDYVLKHGDIIVGYISMQAIKPEAVEHIFNRRNGSSVQLEDMEPIVPGKPWELHISGIGVKTGIKRLDAK